MTNYELAMTSFIAMLHPQLKSALHFSSKKDFYQIAVSVQQLAKS
ncbi:hypothetical protein [Scytonema sp. UIC 10036]|nr:hypothetical protein [Scytonema sp. UIC 10036]